MAVITGSFNSLVAGTISGVFQNTAGGVLSGVIGTPGPTGATGATGAAGPGVAAGGTAGQVLAKIDGTNYNTEWVNAEGDYLPLAGGLMDNNAHIYFPSDLNDNLAGIDFNGVFVRDNANSDNISNFFPTEISVKYINVGTTLTAAGVTFPDNTVQTTAYTGGSYLPLAGGAMNTGAEVTISDGSGHDSELAGWGLGVELSSDNAQGTTVEYNGLNVYNSAGTMEVTPTGLTFPNASVQSTAFLGYGSPAFTGNPTAPTASPGDNDTTIATTAFVTTADNLKANLASPTFTGVVTIPSGALISGYLTTTAGDAAYVPINGAGGTPTSITLTNASGTAASLTAGSVTTNANLTGVVTSTGNATAIADAALSIGKTSGLQAAIDLKANLASPSLTGTPLSTTASIDTNTTQIATTAFVRDMLSDCTWSVPPISTTTTATSGAGATYVNIPPDTGYVFGPNVNIAGYAQKGMQMFARSNSTYGFNYTKEMRIACKMAINWTSTFTGITYTLIQRLGNSGTGALGVIGFGITINMATKVLSIVAHNGTTLTTKTTSWVAPTSGICSIDFMVKSDGTGTVSAYADGVFIDSTTGMSTTTTSANTSMFAAVEVNSVGTTSTANATGYVCNLRTLVAHG